MTDCSYRSSIRCTTFTCLITEQTSLDTLYYSNAKNSASSLIESESILNNGKQNLWQTGDIPNNMWAKRLKICSLLMQMRLQQAFLMLQFLMMIRKLRILFSTMKIMQKKKQSKEC